MRALITGGAGFIGHHLIDHLLHKTDWELVALDYLSGPSACSWQRLEEAGSFQNPRVRTCVADCSEPLPHLDLGEFDYIFHLAAETHVDRSITHPRDFVVSNVLGTMEALEFARKQDHLLRFLYFSTDEVFGPAPADHPGFKEWDRYNSGNPYSATKAGAEELVLAWSNTYRVPVAITHCMNAFGERQHVEKFIPGTIARILAGETVIIHADASCRRPGSRFYIHARNISDAVLYFLLSLDDEVKAEKCNVVGEREVNNLEMALMIAGVIGKSLIYRLVDFHSSRPGHDLRYALDSSKLRELGWRAPVDFEQSLRRTVLWYLSNRRWLNHIPEETEDGVQRSNDGLRATDGPDRPG